MLCRICGTPIKAGEKFCSLCGEKVEIPEEIQLRQVQQPYGQQPDNRQPYGQRSYRQQPYEQEQYGRQAYRQQSYEQQPFGGQPSGNMYYSVSGRSRKGLWITLCLVAVLAVAAVLVFNVFGDKLTVSQGKLPTEKTPPFKGDTLQTKFANDTAKVVYDALDVFGNVGINTNELAEQPFDMKLDMTMKAMKQKADMRMDLAYDNETLGMNINSGGNTIKMALIDDVWYAEMLGSVVGFDFNSPEDLSKPMALQDRMTALVKGIDLPKNISGNESYTILAGLLMQGTLSESDYTALAELLINSIDESCFESGGSKTTLTLHTEDIAVTLRTFAKKLETDQKLKKMYEDFIKANLETPEDVIQQINGAADALEEQKDTLDLELNWEVSYKNNKPASFEIKADDGGEKYIYSFGYEKNEGSTDITFDLTPGSSSPGISGACKFKEADSGTELEGTLIAQGQIMTFYGSIAFSENNSHGTITMYVPNSINMANAQGTEVSVDFNLTVDIGVPDTKVKYDGRFKIDTSGASIIDGSSMFGTLGLPGTNQAFR